MTEILLRNGVSLQAQLFIQTYAQFLKRQGKLPVPGMFGRFEKCYTRAMRDIY